MGKRKEPVSEYSQRIWKNIFSILEQKNEKAAFISDLFGRDPSMVTRAKNGERDIKVDELAKIARELNMSIEEVIEYPNCENRAPDRVIVSFEVSPDLRDDLLKLVNSKKSKLTVTQTK